MYYGLSDPFLSQYPYVRRRGPSQRPQFFGCVVFYGHVLLQTMALRQNGAGSQTERGWLSDGTSRGQDSRLFGLVDDGAARRG